MGKMVGPGSVGGNYVGGDQKIDQHAGGDIAGRDIIRQVAAPVGVAALHQLPSPPGDFTGRAEELTALRAAIAGANSAGAAIFGLRGQGGVGKTALALVLAHELKARYPDAQLYVDLRGADEQAPLTPEDALAGFIRAFEPTAKLPEGRAELQAIYRSLLDGKRALVLLDNARDAAQVTPLLPPPGCLALVTSRQHFTLPGLFPRNLDTLPRADSIALLLKLAPRIGGHAAAIAQACGDLPLALRLAGSALAEKPNLTPEGYLARLHDEKRRFRELDAVGAALALSEALLPPDLQAKWRALSVFPADFDWRGAAAVWTGEADEAIEADTTDALGELMRYSLLDYDEKTSRYSLHDLARAWADTRLDEVADETARLRHATHYMQVASAADDLYEEGGEAVVQGLALFDREWANIRAGQQWAAAHATQNGDIARLVMQYALWALDPLGLRLHTREFIGWLETARSAAVAVDARGEEGTALGNLGNQYLDLGEPRRAMEFSEQRLVIAREIGDRLGEGAGLGGLGNAYADLGEIRRAIDFYEQALIIDREIGDRRGEGQDLGNLGNAYADLGETRRAIEHYEQWLVIAREIGDRRGEGQDLGNLGNAYVALGQTRRAIEFYEQQLVIAREIGDRRGEGNVLGNLGIAYADLGETRRAIEFYEKQLVITREIGDRRGEANGSWNLGLQYEKAGDLARAIALMQVCLDYERELGHPDAEADAARVETLRQQLAAWRGRSSAKPSAFARLLRWLFRR